MKPTALTAGQKFLVLESPPGITLLNGTVRGVFVAGETLTYRMHQYNSYDGCYMMYFERAADGTERVWIGEYNETEAEFFERLEKYFKLIG